MYFITNRRYKKFFIITIALFFTIFTLYVILRLTYGSQVFRSSIGYEEFLDKINKIENNLNNDYTFVADDPSNVLETYKSGKDTKDKYIYDMIMDKSLIHDMEQRKQKAKENNTKDNHFTDSIPEILPKNKITVCDVNQYLVPESYDGYNIDCPVDYVIQIDNVFYGRRRNERSKCNTDSFGQLLDDSLLNVAENEKCGSHPIEYLRKKCNNQRTCNIKVTNAIFTNPCLKRRNYIDLEYHCLRKVK